MDAEDLVKLGRITKPHGVRGEVKAFPFAGCDQLAHLSRAWLQLTERGTGRDWRCFEIEKSRPQGKFTLLKFRDIDTRTAAEKLSGVVVSVLRQELPQLREGEYYLHDFMELQVMTQEGQLLGRVSGILETGGHDVLAITGTGHEYLIPLHDDFVVSRDREKLVLRLPPGLLEMNE